MGIKDGWALERLNKACQIRPPKKEAKEILNEGDSVSFVPMKILGEHEKYFSPVEDKLLSEVTSSYTYFKNEDVLLAKITPCFENGKLGIAKNLTNGIGFGSSEYIVYRTSDYLNHEFLYYFLSQESFRIKGKSQMTGAVGHKRIPKEFYELTEIPIPPLTEQKQIVALLDQAFSAIDQAIANLEKNIQNAQELFQSKLNDVFSQRGEGWVERTLKEVCSIITDGTHQTPKYFDAGYIFLSSKNVTSGKIDWDNVRYLDEEQHQKMYKRLTPQINDILLAKNGTTGVAAIVDVDKVFDIYVSLALLRPTELIHPYYLLHFINSTKAKKQFNKRLKGMGVPNLHLKEIREVVINFPSSLNHQKDISEFIDELMNQRNLLLENYQKKIKNLEELKKSILQQAFNGELT